MSESNSLSKMIDFHTSKNSNEFSFFSSLHDARVLLFALTTNLLRNESIVTDSKGTER